MTSLLPITVVSGLPRSGTSLVMQMLAAAGVEPLVDGVRGADESNPRGYFELEAVKRTRADAGWVAAAGGRAVKVIHALLADLPRDRAYRVIVMRRDMDEVLDSQSAMLARLGRPETALARERLAAVLRTQLEQAVALLRSEPCFEVLEVEHGRLISEAHSEAARMEAFLGLRGVAAAMAACVDPSLHRVRSGAQAG